MMHSCIVVELSLLSESHNLNNDYCIRNTNIVLISDPRPTMYEKSPRYTGGKFFNLLPKHIKELRTDHQIPFKL